MKAPQRACLKRFSAHRLNQRGASAVEFALIASLLFTLLFGIIEMGRVLFYWNTATEATRMGARLAVVCDQNASAVIKNKMYSMLSILRSDNITINYTDVDGVSCSDAHSCRYVTVSISGLKVITLIPLIPLNISMPPFTTTLPRESMGSTNPDDSTNPDCT
jgi:hypothetical protein